MHLWRLWIALPLLIAASAAAAVIYKWTDADGVVHYSDQAVPGAEKIVTSSASNGVGKGTRAPADRSAPAQISTPTPQQVEVSIDSPSPEQVFFGDEIVPVHLHLQPELQSDQSISWHLNGKTLDDQAPTAQSFNLQGLPRGTYAIAATVTNGSGQAQSSPSVTFYVRQPSELAPQHKKS
jgi:Domain of unknown function (DUF4124)